MANKNGTLGFIGLGRMGRCMVKGLLESQTFKKSEVFFTTKHDETASAVEKDLGIKSCRTNSDLVENSDILVLAVKPQNSSEVLEEIGPKVSKGKTVVSIVASIPTLLIESKLSPGISVIRAMPNTPAFVGAGMTAWCSGAHAVQKDWERATTLFQPLGKVAQVDEKHMDAVTGLSGCGPAYLYVVLESLTDAGIKVGLPRELATQLAGQTVLGAARMLLDTGRHPAALKDEVTTPAGCTIDGLLELEEGKLRVTLIKAVVQATKRAKALAKQVKL
jgi:pyrroline-5-carboxylate reductase